MSWRQWPYSFSESPCLTKWWLCSTGPKVLPDVQQHQHPPRQPPGRHHCLPSSWTCWISKCSSLLGVDPPQQVCGVHPTYSSVYILHICEFWHLCIHIYLTNLCSKHMHVRIQNQLLIMYVSLSAALQTMDVENILVNSIQIFSFWDKGLWIMQVRFITYPPSSYSLSSVS